MKRVLPIAAALGFIAFFITIIGIANRGEGSQWWAFIDRIPYGDKVGHLGLVGTLSFLCNLAFQPGKRSFFLPFLTTTTAILGLLLTIEEISQAFQPHRTCDPFDWLADLAGLAVGQAAALRIQSRCCG